MRWSDYNLKMGKGKAVARDGPNSKDDEAKPHLTRKPLPGEPWVSESPLLP